ncbi:MAG: hypothetical protein O2807_10240 [bacterium]|nr:hypothetical protein [bacterium]
MSFWRYLERLKKEREQQEKNLRFSTLSTQHHYVSDLTVEFRKSLLRTHSVNKIVEEHASPYRDFQRGVMQSINLAGANSVNKIVQEHMRHYQELINRIIHSVDPINMARKEVEQNAKMFNETLNAHRRAASWINETFNATHKTSKNIERIYRVPRSRKKKNDKSNINEEIHFRSTRMSRAIDFFGKAIPGNYYREAWIGDCHEMRNQMIQEGYHPFWVELRTTFNIWLMLRSLLRIKISDFGEPDKQRKTGK